ACSKKAHFWASYPICARPAAWTAGRCTPGSNTIVPTSLRESFLLPGTSPTKRRWRRCGKPVRLAWRSPSACSSLLTLCRRLLERPMNSPGSKEDSRIRLLVVDDEQSIRKLCVTVGEALGFVCLEAESGESALALLEEQPAHMVLTDMVMPHMSGLEFLEKVKKLLPRSEVALMTGHGSIETAVQAMKLGA